MFFTILLILSISLVVFWAYKVIYSIFFSPLKDIPGPILLQLFPIIDIYHFLIGDHPTEILKLHEKYGNAVRVGWNEISFASQEAAKVIYSGYKFVKGPEYEGFYIVGENLFNTRNEIFHKNRKKMILPSYSETSINSFKFSIMEVGIHPLVRKITELSSQGKIIDLGLLFHCMSFDIIGELAFGEPFGMLNDIHHPINKWLQNLMIHSVFGAIIPSVRKIKTEAIKNIYKFSDDAISRSISNTSISNKENKRKTLLEYFLKAEDKDTGRKLTRKEVAEESILQLGAGTDTTSNALLWTFYLLLKHPNIYSKLYKELKDKFSSLDQINYDVCRTECHYLKAVLHESLRIYPPASGTLGRIATKDCIIQGHFIPEGTVVGVAPYVLHNRSTLWDSPRTFKPERWIQNNKFQSSENFMPFSLGPRACIGRSLAWLELYLTVATLVYEFDLKLNDNDLELEPYSVVVYKPKNGELLVKAYSRSI